MSENTSPQNNTNNVNIPNFEELYKQEAARLLKMVNEQMVYYFENNNQEKVETLNIYQIISKIEKFEASVPGIDILKKDLCNDMMSMAKHVEKEVTQTRQVRTAEMNRLKNLIFDCKNRKKANLVKVIFFQWNLIPEFSKIDSEIHSLRAKLEKLEIEEATEKRTSLNKEQLIKVSHLFREKYLNIPLPKSE